MNINDDQLYDPLDDSVDDDYEDIVAPTGRNALRKILGFSGNGRTHSIRKIAGARTGIQHSIIVVREPEKKEPGLYYLNRSENPIEEGRHWISSQELYDPTNKFALLNAGHNSWGLKMYPDQFKNGFEDHYLRYGGVGAYNHDFDDDALIYLVRFHNQEVLEQFKLTSWNVPLHHFAPLPHSQLRTEVFVDTNTAQVYGWRERFKGHGFTDDEIMGIVNMHHDFDRMELLFFNDTEMLNRIYRSIGGKWEKEWLLRNMKEEA